MTEKVVEQAVEDETEGDAPDTQQVKSGKAFTQEDVNKLIAKEKAAWKRQQEKAVGERDTEAETLREQLSARDEVISKQVELLMQDLELDEITKELLAEKDPLAQFNTLVKIMEKKGKQDIPRTPQGQKKQAEFQSSFRPRI